jgi:hypothetical protein
VGVGGALGERLVGDLVFDVDDDHPFGKFDFLAGDVFGGFER